MRVGLPGMPRPTHQPLPDIIEVNFAVGVLALHFSAEQREALAAAKEERDKEAMEALAPEVFRHNGNFNVQNGVIVVPQEKEQSGLWDSLGRFAGTVARYIFEAIIPSAHAMDLTASNDTPTVFYNETDIGAETSTGRCPKSQITSSMLWMAMSGRIPGLR